MGNVNYLNLSVGLILGLFVRLANCLVRRIKVMAWEIIFFAAGGADHSPVGGVG
jgi:hypothetical protein